jgi:hypothetical protein
MTETSLATKKFVTVATCLPSSMVAAIDQLASVELLSRSTWLRRTVLDAITSKIAKKDGK